MVASLTFYGGVDEIGGNKILVKTDTESILLDFGRRMGFTSEFYSEFLQIRSKNALRDMLRLGILPKIDGIYAAQYLDTRKLFENKADIDEIPFDEAPDYWSYDEIEPYDFDNPAIDGIFLSHAHFDHMQDISFLDPNIPIFATEETKILANAICDISTMHVDDQFYECKRKEVIRPKIPSRRSDYKTLFPGELDYSNVSEDPTCFKCHKTKYEFTQEYEPVMRDFYTDLEGNVGGIDYKLIPIDHSVPGACSVLLNLPDDKKILYTGDLRFHGESGPTIEEYLDEIGNQVDVLIIEGTRIESEEILEEAEVKKQIEEDIRGKDKLVLINFNWKDLSRFNLIKEITKALGKILVINPKLAYLLYEMHCLYPDIYQDPREIDNVKVYLKREGSMLYSKRDYDKYKMGYLHHHGSNYRKADRNIIRIAERMGVGGRLDNDENPLPEKDLDQEYIYKYVYDLATHHLFNGIKAYEIRKNPDKYVMMFSYWDSNELFDLIPEEHVDPSAYYIAASTEPFNDEMYIDEEKFMNWLDKFDVEFNHTIKVGKRVFERRHISGHASQPEIIELVDKIKPKKIIPVHTEKPEKFTELFGDEYEVILPEYGEENHI